jgi:hypothetical protein
MSKLKFSVHGVETIRIIPKSHKIGASVFSHKIKLKNNNFLEVYNDNNKKIDNCLIDKANKEINGKLLLRQTRRDLTKKGSSVIKGNFINRN